MDDGNILSRKNFETNEKDVNKKIVERVDKKKNVDRYLRTYCESDVDIEKLTLDERERFFTWRRTVIPRNFLEAVIKKEYGRQLHTNSLILISDIVKMFIGEIVTKCLNDVDEITREDLIRVINTPKSQFQIL